MPYYKKNVEEILSLISKFAFTKIPIVLNIKAIVTIFPW